MSEPHREGHAEEDGVPAPEPEQTPEAESTAPPRPTGAARQTGLWLIAVLVLVIAGVALSPFWAPDLAALLPWGEKSAAPAGDYAALTARLAALERRPTTAPGPDPEAVKSAQSALARRIDQLEAARGAEHQAETGVDAVKEELQRLEQRVATLEAQFASRMAGTTDDTLKMQQELSRLGKVTADLAERLPQLERQMGANGGAHSNVAALLVTLLQMREAIAVARPFPAEYDAFIALAHDQPDLVAAAQPLAGPARAGIAGRTVLGRRLTELAGPIAGAKEPPPAGDWPAQAWTKLRALVTIRRIDGASQTPAEMAINSAELALARGDLSGAVSALDALSGPNAEAARPWLQMARERLVAETALADLQGLLAARIGGGAAEAAARKPL